MTKAMEPIDARLLELIGAALAEAPEAADASTEGRETLATRILTAIRPAVGAAAERRRDLSLLRGAYKNGYLDGQRAGRFSRWHDVIFRESATAKSLQRKTPEQAAAEERFARYNG